MSSKLNFDEDLARMQFDAMQTRSRKMSFMLQFAILAPSVFNSQPWIWKLDGDSMNLYADLARSEYVPRIVES